MDKKEMCERLCVLSNNEIVKRRKPLRGPIVWTVAGAVLLAVNGWLDDDVWGDLKAVLVLVGGVALAVGVGLMLARTFGAACVPYSVRTGKYLRYRELYFPKQQMREVMRLCAAGDVGALRSMEQSSVPAVVVALYATDDDRLAACQPFEYIELEYRPLGEMTLVRS